MWRKLIGILYSPTKTLKLLARMPDSRIPWINASLIIFFTSLSYLSLYFHITVTGSEGFVTTFNNYFLASLISVFLVNTLLTFTTWFIIVLVYWLITKRVVVRNYYSDVFKLVVACLTPLIFSRIILAAGVYITLPSIIIFEGQSAEMIAGEMAVLFNSYTWIVYKIIDAGVWLWCAFIISIGFKEFYKISFKKSLLISYLVIGFYLFLIMLPVS
ncbi:MAG: YIP1 family protein [Candidatus Odinarchaeota archaeon]